MAPGDCIKLQAINDDTDGKQTFASLLATTTSSYLLIADDGVEQQAVALEEADELLSPHFKLPATQRTEMSVTDAMAMREREARHARAERIKEKRAIAELATLQW